MSGPIIIVDESDNFQRFAEKNDRMFGEIFRCSALWITNSKGQVLLARRSDKKMISPGKWGPAVVGTHEKGDDYLSNIIRESEEELGLTDISPRTGPKRLVSGVRSYFCQFYLLTLDREPHEFKLNPREVNEVRWFTKEQIRDKYNNEREDLTNNMAPAVELFCL